MKVDTKYYIACLGEDNLKHYILPWEDKALCGEGVKDKKFGNNLYNGNTRIFWCGYCDNMFDELILEEGGD